MKIAIEKQLWLCLTYASIIVFVVFHRILVVFKIIFSVCLLTKSIVLLNEWLKGNLMMFIFYNLLVCTVHELSQLPRTFMLVALRDKFCVSKFQLIVKFHWDHNVERVLAILHYFKHFFLWYTVYIYFNLLVRHYFCMFMYDLSWKNVKRFIGCLQFFVMDSLKICAIFKLTSWQSSFRLTGYLYIIYMYTYTNVSKSQIQCNCICFLLNVV